MTWPDPVTTGARAPWHQRHRRALALAGAASAAGMTVLWSIVVPDKAETTTGLQSLAIQLGHPASWALLMGLAVAVAIGVPKVVRATLAWAALASYLTFLTALAL